MDREIKRDITVIIRVSQEEKEKLEKMARENDESVSKFIVKKVFSYKNYMLGK